MKRKIITLIALTAFTTTIFTFNAFAVNSPSSAAICNFDGCQETQDHLHDGTAYSGHWNGDGHSHGNHNGSGHHGGGHHRR